MEAKNKPVFHVTKERTKLQDVIPLNTPFSVYIEPSSLCNFKCKFCFQSDPMNFKKAGIIPKVMPFEIFKKAADDLKLFPQKIKLIHLVFRGEPLANKHFPKMVKYLKEIDAAEEITTTTNAFFLTKEMSDDIIAAGLDTIKISIEGLSDDKYEEITGVRANFADLVEKVKYFYTHKKHTHVYVKIVDAKLSEQEKQLFYDTFGNYSDEIFIESIVDMWQDAELDFIEEHKSSEGMYGIGLNHAKVCSKIFYSINICADGTVQPCTGDWSQKFTLGNITEKSLYDIWNGKHLNTLRLNHLQFKKDLYPMCVNCNVLQTCIPDNIDKYAEMLYQKLK